MLITTPLLQHDLVYRLRLTYDRQEIEDVLDELETKGVIASVTRKENPNLPDWLAEPADRSLVAKPRVMWDFVS